MMHAFKFAIFGICVVLLFSSCKTQFLFEQPPTRDSTYDSLFLSITSGNQYVIRKDDKLTVSIWNNDDISVGSIYGIYNSNEGYGKWLLVDAKGEVAIPQIGNLKVQGLTLVQMKELLLGKLSETIKQPIIDVKVLNKDITVLGEVKNPGKVHLEKENNTITDIIGTAGDFDLYGNKAKIQIIRIIDDTARSIDIDLTTMKGFQRSNIQILPGDVVYVTPKKSKEWDKRAGSTILPIASAITAILLIYKTFF